MNLKNAINFVYFHRRRITVTTGVVGTYFSTCYSARNWDNELIKIGIAGSLSNVIVECSFHFADTVNIRTKANETNISTTSMINKIYRKEGIIGFGKGFSAAFYGAAIYGFSYFVIYKMIKSYLAEKFEGKVDMAVCYVLAAFVTECLTLSVKFPYDLIKCRLQSVNYVFKYQNLVHAFKKEIKKDGLKSLYRGSMPFLAMYATFVTL